MMKSRGVVEDQRRRITCAVTVNGKLMKTHQLSRGPFELVTPLPEIDEPNQLVFVDLEIKPSTTAEGVNGKLGRRFTTIGAR